MDDATQAMFNAGKRFELYAEKLFADGVMLGFNNYDEYSSLTERTRQILADGATTI